MVENKTRILKVAAIDSQTGKVVSSYPSKQIKDPFSEVQGYGVMLLIPPYNPDQLVVLAEAHPIHSAAIEQKTSDVIAEGFQVSPDNVNTVNDQGERIKDWWNSLFDEFTSYEVLYALWQDYETIGIAALEVVRDVKGLVKRLYHIPGHTIRAHENNILFAQMVNGRLAYFKRWGITDINYLLSDGRVAPKSTLAEKLANEILVFRKPCRRSSWYGIPIYISAIGYITMGVAARDFNIKFFENFREPRHLVIISGLEGDVDDAADNIEYIWKTQLKDSPHHNLFIPIAGQANVNIQRLGAGINDMHFSHLMEQVDAEILVAHRMPPDRLGLVKQGFLGGSVTQSINQIYKDGVVSKSQVILESRLTKFVKEEYKKLMGEEVSYHVDFEDLDIKDEIMDVNVAVQLVKSTLVTINEARLKLGLEKHEAFGDMTLLEYMTKLAPTGAPGGLTGLESLLSPPAEATDTWKQRDVNYEVEKRLEKIDEYIEQLLSAQPIEEQ